MQQLDYLTVRGFRSIASLEKVHLGSVNVLIGANGAGKSNFLAVFALLQAAREGRLDSYRLIKRTIQTVAPFFDDFQLKPIELTGDTLLLEWSHVGSEA